jgi:thiol:disulfide interchange protein DsbA
VGAAGLLALAPLNVQAADPEFTVVTPSVPTESPGKIEVLEFFSYGCPHCKEFHPLLSRWVGKLPADVAFKRVPVSFGRGQWANLARLYYTLELTGELGRLDAEVFHALHEQRARLFDEASISEWVGSRGGNVAKFRETFNAFSMQPKVNRGDQLAQAYKISGVPTLAIDGRFLVASDSFEGTLATADKLIARIRGEKASARK